MGKFSAAKIFDALDQKLQKALNYLIDLLETGYVTSAMVNGKQTEIRITPQDIIQVMVDNKLVGGLKLVNSELTFVAGALAGPNDTRTFIRVGDDPALTNADFIYGWYSATSTAPYTKRFKISEYYGGAELASINDDNGDSYLSLRTYATFGGSPIDSPYMSMFAKSAASGYGSSTRWSIPGSATRNGTVFQMKDGLFYLIDEIDQVGLPAYANNAAALADGLVEGCLYRTGGDPDAVCIVH